MHTAQDHTTICVISNYIVVYENSFNDTYKE